MTDKKKRNKYIEIQFDKAQAADGFKVFPDGRVALTLNGEELVPARAKGLDSYERNSGKPKVLRTIPLSPTNLNARSVTSLGRFKLVVAVDTNTKSMGEDTYSCSCAIYSVIKGDGSALGVTAFAAWFAEILNPKVSPEKIGWFYAYKILKKMGPKLNGEIGFIVDAHLGDLPSFDRGEEILDGFALGGSIRMLYATTDTGSEEPANRLIKSCDRAAKEQLRYMERDKNLKASLIRENDEWHEGVRLGKYNWPMSGIIITEGIDFRHGKS